MALNNRNRKNRMGIGSNDVKFKYPFADDQGRCIGCCPPQSFAMNQQTPQYNNTGLGKNQFGKPTDFNKTPNSHKRKIADINNGGMYGITSTHDHSRETIATFDMGYHQHTECFVAGTDIIMSDGSNKNIEDVKIGDEVLSYNTKTDKFENQLVTELFTQTHNLKDGDFTVKIKFDNGTTTHNTIANPFWSKDKGFVAVDEKRCNRVHQWVIASNNGNDIDGLYEGDTLYFYSDDGTLEEVKVESIEYVMEKDITTFDITVKNTHTFFANGILTHNSGGSPGPTPTPTPTPPTRYCNDPCADNYEEACGSTANGCDSSLDLAGEPINCYQTVGNCVTNCCCNYFSFECGEDQCCHNNGLSNGCCPGEACFPCTSGTDFANCLP